MLGCLKSASIKSIFLSASVKTLANPTLIFLDCCVGVVTTIAFLSLNFRENSIYVLIFFRSSLIVSFVLIFSITDIHNFFSFFFFFLFLFSYYFYIIFNNFFTIYHYISDTNIFF